MFEAIKQEYDSLINFDQPLATMESQPDESFSFLVEDLRILRDTEDWTVARSYSLIRRYVLTNFNDSVANDGTLVFLTLLSMTVGRLLAQGSLSQEECVSQNRHAAAFFQQLPIQNGRKRRRVLAADDHE
jgi:hypothetical protein